MSSAIQFDLARQEILDHYQGRIDRGDRNKLTREERDNLALLLVDRLVELNQQGKDDQKAIRELCEAEKALLEQGSRRGRSTRSTCQPIPVCSRKRSTRAGCN